MHKSSSSISRLQLSNFKLSTLLDITLSINDNVTTEQLLRQFEQLLRVDLNIGKVVIFSYNQRNWECILKSGFIEETSSPASIARDILSGYADISNISSIEAGFLKSFDAIIPVFHKTDPVAYVLIGDIDEDREGISPTIKHLKFVQTIANVVVVAIENKRLYQESLAKEAFKKELELASRMQSMLIPRIGSLPVIPELDVAAFYCPHSEVGGDYYDFLDLGGQEFGFCIADVSGKGISAAILMSNFQANFRALFSAGTSLTELVIKLNAQVMGNANGEKFITIFIAKYNAVTRILTYINAGHNQPVLYCKSKQENINLTLGCIGLGMLDELPVVRQGEQHILPGDRLICYTDGLNEAENDKEEEFGTAALEACISEASGIGDALHTLNSQLNEFLGTQKNSDDVTLLGLEFK
jgi:phosphoserine phosphatase RsbU/P